MIRFLHQLKLDLFFGLVVLVLYVFLEIRGYVFASADARGTIPPGTKAMPGGYRRGHDIWFIGFHGGK